MRFASISCSLVLVSVPVIAHHGSAHYYDMDNIVSVEGEIVSVTWRNPHVMIELRRTDDGGANEIWDIEGSSVNSLARVGVEADSLSAGGAVTITGAISRHGLPAMAGHVVTFADGTEVPIWPRPAKRLGLEVRPAPLSAEAAEAARSKARGLFRIWSRRDLTGLFLEDGYLPFTEAAIAARAAWNPLEDDPVLDCTPRGMSSIMNTPHPIEFVDRGYSVLLRMEEFDTERVIHIDDAVNPESQPRTPLGYSVGHWENARTLVVTTSRISDPFFDDEGTPQSEDAVVTERFSMNEEGTRLTYESFHDDPYTFTEPARWSSYWDWNPGEIIRRFDCLSQ
jgi:hypothetical protein